MKNHSIVFTQTKSHCHVGQGKNGGIWDLKDKKYYIYMKLHVVSYFSIISFCDCIVVDSHATEYF